MRHLITVMILLMLAGCRKAPVFQADAGHAKPWTHLNFRNDPDAFQFVVITDVEGGRRPGVLEKAVRDANLLQPEFVISIGDLSSSGGDAEATRKAWEAVDPALKKLEMPFFYVAGNHDIGSTVTEHAWRERMGSPYYHFLYKNVLFLCLSTEEAPYTHEGGMSDAQRAYFAKALAENPSPRWTMVLMHKPLWLMNPPEWAKMQGLLGDRPCTVLAGHQHVYTKYVRENGRRYIRLATTGGASVMGGPHHGEFDQIVWVTMTAEGPRLANLDLKGIFDEDVATETHMLLKDMLGAGEVGCEPVRNDGGVFERAATNVTLLNKGDVPVRMKGTFLRHKVLRVDPAGFDVEVPAQTLAPLKVPVTITAPEPAGTGDIPPLELALVASANPPGGQPVTMEQVHKIVIDRFWECPARTAPVTVDGVLDEWTSLPISLGTEERIPAGAETWEGPGDFSVRFAAEHDESRLYFAVEVTDDKFVFSKEGYPWFYDTLFMQLDVRDDPERSRERTKVPQTADQFFLNMLGNPAKVGDPMFFIPLPDTRPKGMQVAYVLSDKGYNLEMALPASYLDAKQGKPWEAFRLNLALSDADATTGPRTRMEWLPPWGGPDNWAGSGTFRRR